MMAVDAALKANALEHAQCARAKRVQRKLNTKVPSRKKLGTATVENQLRQEGMHKEGSFGNAHTIDCLQLSLTKCIVRRPHPASVIASLRLSKRLGKPD